MQTNILKSNSASGKNSVREPIELNRIATIIATVVVLFFFTRSTPFPANTYWELAIARDFDLSAGWVMFPETIALYIEESAASLLGLKALFHVIYFILCSLICVWIFKNREPLPGLIGLSVFAFTMQGFLDLRMLLTSIFVLGLLALLDGNRMKGNFGILLIPIIAAASGLGLNTLLLVMLIICHAVCNKQYNLSLILCAVIGGLFFPEGMEASVSTDSIFNLNFLPKSDMEILYLLSGIFLLVNLISLGRLKKHDLPNLIFYVLTGIASLIYPTTIPIFILMGLFILIKLYSDQKPLQMGHHMFGLLIITAMVYLYLFLNPYGIKLNSGVKGMLGKELAPIMDGYIHEMPINKHDLGELAWKGMIRLDQFKVRKNLFEEELLLMRTPNGEYKVLPKLQNGEISF